MANEEERDNYKRLSKAIKKSARRDKIRYTEDLANKAEIAARKNRMKEVYDTRKQLTGRFNKSNTHVRDKQGRLIKTDEETLTRWAEHFSDILNPPAPTAAANIPPAMEDLEMLPRFETHHIYFNPNSQELILLVSN